jgi:hypothetical protein
MTTYSGMWIYLFGLGCKEIRTQVMIVQGINSIRIFISFFRTRTIIKKTTPITMMMVMGIFPAIAAEKCFTIAVYTTIKYGSTKV